MIQIHNNGNLITVAGQEFCCCFCKWYRNNVLHSNYKCTKTTMKQKPEKPQKRILYDCLLFANVSRSVYISVLGRPGSENGVGVVIVC